MSDELVELREVIELEQRLTAAQLDVLERGREIERLRREVEFEANGETFNHDWTDLSLPSVCACVSDEQADQLINAGFTRPVCAVHPENGGAV